MRIKSFLSVVITLALFCAHTAKAEKPGNEWPYANFTEGLTFAVARDKWTEFKNANWNYFTSVVALMNLTQIQLDDNLGYMYDNTYNVSSDASDAAMTLNPDTNGVVVTCEKV